MWTLRDLEVDTEVDTDLGGGGDSLDPGSLEPDSD